MVSRRGGTEEEDAMSVWRSALCLAALTACVLAPCAPARGDEIEAGEVVVPAEEPPPAAAAPAEVAEDECEFDCPGFYAGLGLSYYRQDFEGQLGDQLDGDAWGFNLRAGYRFLPFLAAELHYEYASDFGVDALGGRIAIDTNVVTANVKAIAPLGRFQPYAGGGVGILNASTSSSGVFADVDFDGTEFAGRVFGGIDVFLTRSISIFAEADYVLPTGSLDDLRYVSPSFGLRYLF
jgi:opacity protein-like surface antigen